MVVVGDVAHPPGGEAMYYLFVWNGVSEWSLIGGVSKALADVLMEENDRLDTLGW